MKKDYTHISMILDRSGSMKDLIKDAIGGFNSFLTNQKTISGQATMSVVQFDEEYEILHDFKLIKDVPELNLNTYIPTGMTALIDAIGRTIESTGKHLESLKEENRPEKVIVVIITDGLENCSKLYEPCKVKEMIEHQSSVYGWQFTFIGSNQDAILSASDLGIAGAAALSYDANQEGVKMSYDALSRSIGSLRMGITKTLSYSPQDREDAQKLK
jgi:uncharacterized protein YegL